MKIDKAGIAQASIFVLAIAGIITIGDTKRQSSIEYYKSQVLENDSNRYKLAVQSEQNKPMTVKNYIWEKAYYEMQDSMRKTGAIQKNYFEGSQMISDSLKIK